MIIIGLALVCLVLTAVFALILSIIIRKKRAKVFHPENTSNATAVEPVYEDILEQEMNRAEPITEHNICYGDGKIKPNTCTDSTEPVYTEIDRLSVVLNEAYNITL